MRRNVVTLGVVFLIGLLTLNFSPTTTGAQSLGRPSLRTISYTNTSAPPASGEVFSPPVSTAGMYRNKGGLTPLNNGNSHPLVDEAELSINVDASPDEVVTGTNVTYTITVMNEGSAPAAAFTVKDELPPETTFVSCETIGGGLCGGTDNSRVISFDSLAPDATATITLVATVNCPVANATEIDNTAEIHPSTPDPEADENDNETVFITASNPTPSITDVTASPSQLWPPNHQMVNISINYRVVDNCGPILTKLSVTSNEPVNGTGDGDTAPDWEIINDHLVRLRAERAGNGSGRIYTITITASDSVGQSSSRTVTVSVPKNQKK